MPLPLRPISHLGAARADAAGFVNIVRAGIAEAIWPKQAAADQRALSQAWAKEFIVSSCQDQHFPRLAGLYGWKIAHGLHYICQSPASCLFAGGILITGPFLCSYAFLYRLLSIRAQKRKLCNADGVVQLPLNLCQHHDDAV